jgi:CHAT domain-containing protein
MAYGMGESCDVYFREQADLVGGLPWKRCSVFPERTSKADLLAAMKDYPVIHFACHGSLPAAISDPLAASQIELFPPQVLTAGDVLRCGHVPAELVFLNACQSGRFRMSARSEPDGFWRAFLQAGAASIVATLALIDPDAASALALDFYQHWLGGSSKGKALQKAQCAMIERAAPVEHWGLHILVGDAA